MVFLPEACDYLCETKEEALKQSDSLHSPLMERYQDLAVRTKVWLSLGGLHIKVSASSLYFFLYIIFMLIDFL